MKKIFTLILLTFNILLLSAQTVSITGNAAVIGNQSITLTASITPGMTGTWYWATTDDGLDLSTQHSNVLTVTPSAQGVYVFRALFFDGVNAYYADHKVAIFDCGSQLKDYELQSYTTKAYGTVCWMTQNLRSTRYGDGTAIPFAHAYEDNESYTETYGRLYDYASAFRGETGNAIQGACPNGWQLPMEDDLYALLNHNANAYDYQNGEWIGNSDNNNENFNLTPSGFFNDGTQRYENLFGEAYIILNSPFITNNTYRVGECKYGCPTWLFEDFSSLNGYSIRCVKKPSMGQTTDMANGKVYTAQFFKNGAEAGQMIPQMGIGGQSLTLADNNFTHSGNWEFAGWNTKPDGTGISFTNQQSLVLTQDTTLYAQWHTWCTGTPSPIESPTSRIDSVKDVDGNWYEVVQIGKQCWLKENMKALHYADGTDAGITYVNRDGSNTALYGYLYSWEGAMHNAASTTANPSGVQGVCPTGWHIPSQSEGKQLFDFLGQNNCGCSGDGNTAKALCSTFGWTPNSTTCTVGYDQLSNNVSGFSAVPAGNDVGKTQDFGSSCAIWFATENPSDNRDGRHISVGRASLYPLWTGNNRKYCKFSVRCVRDSVIICDISKTDSTTSSLAIRVNYIATASVQSATANAYTDEACTNEVGTCPGLSNASTSPITGTVTGLNHNTPYYVKVTLFTATGSVSKVAGPFKTKAIMDTITFVANGGTTTMQKQKVTRGVATPLNERTITHTGNWAFIGWSEAWNGESYLYNDKAEITTNGNVTLYAQWHTWCTGTPTATAEKGNSRIDSVKDIDNNWYNVVQIGNQCWLKENMRCTHSPSGNLSYSSGNNARQPKYYLPSSNVTINGVSLTPAQYLKQYGYLYNYLGAVDTNLSGTNVRGICPQGWHIPSKTEFATLKNTAGDISGRYSGGYDWKAIYSDNLPGNYSDVNRNSTGFTALPAGNYISSTFGNFNSAYFWTSTIVSTENKNAYCIYLSQYSPNIPFSNGNNFTGRGFSVRCVRNPIDTITFMPNGGTGSMTKQTVVRGVATPISASTYEHPNTWEISGWNKSADGSGTAYANDASITTNGNDTLYAQWHTWCTRMPIATVENGNARIDSVKDIDNNWYNVVQIGNQCWMKENMRTTKYADGRNVNDYQSSGNVERDGLRYNWFAALDTTYTSPIAAHFTPANTQGICPTGWHVPTNADWDALYNNYGRPICKLATTYGWKNSTTENSPGYNQSANNISGFSIYPNGCEGTLTEGVSFWCSTVRKDYNFPIRLYFNYNNNNWGFYFGSSGNMKLSVRCLRDKVFMVTTADGICTSASTATCGGIVVEEFGKEVTSRGVCWSTSENPTISDYHTSDGTGTGSFTSSITGLDDDYNYYIRAYATTIDDTVYGQQIRLSPGIDCLAAGTRITMADGSYKKVENIVKGDLVRTFNHETGEISSAEICLAWKSKVKKQVLNLTFASNKTVGIIGSHDFLLENTRKYVRINKDNVAEYVGKRFYNAETGSWDALVSYEMGKAVNYYCPYTTKHLNCLAEGMLNCPDDVDYILNIYELDANLKADANQLAADIAQYGLCNVEQDFPELISYKEQMYDLGAQYFYIAIGKGLVPRTIIDDIKKYWTGE